MLKSGRIPAYLTIGGEIFLLVSLRIKSKDAHVLQNDMGPGDGAVKSYVADLLTSKTPSKNSETVVFCAACARVGGPNAGTDLESRTSMDFDFG